MKKGIILQASSRSEGNTNKIVTFFQEKTGFDIVDLNKKNINHFDYDFKNNDDDFNLLFKDIVTNYKTIVFATPIYWYSMSGLLKVFLDRISDFLMKEKDFGRQLRGMNMAVISCSDYDKTFEGFTIPFIESANYLGMNFKGYYHTWSEDNKISKETKARLKKLIFKIEKEN